MIFFDIGFSSFLLAPKKESLRERPWDRRVAPWAADGPPAALTAIAQPTRSVVSSGNRTY
jgi:hypothetical protein